MHLARARGAATSVGALFVVSFPLRGASVRQGCWGAAQMDDDKFYVPNRLEIKPGAFYFVAKCPNTKKILAIERDPDRGSNPYSHADTLVSCHHCQGRHRFETSDIIPCQASEGDDW